MCENFKQNKKHEKAHDVDDDDEDVYIILKPRNIIFYRIRIKQ